MSAFSRTVALPMTICWPRGISTSVAIATPAKIHLNFINTKLVRDYLKAYKATLEYVRAHPEVWDEYAKSINMNNPDERALLQQKMGPNLVARWDADQIAVQKDYLKLVHNIVGESVLKVVPEDLIRNEYIP